MSKPSLSDRALHVSKQLKYALKLAVLRRLPRLYWEARRRLRGIPEAEIALLGGLCSGVSVALDVGANFGMYTHGLAQLVPSVHAFEPIPRLAAALASGYRSQPHVRVHNLALSDVSGEACLRVPRSNLGYSTVEPLNDLAGKVVPGVTVDEVRVPTRRLDDLAIGDVGFVKIDVEGHEVAVLQGAMRMLAASRPVLLIEAEDRHRAHSRRDVCALLRPLDFGVFELRGSSVHEVAADGPEDACRNLILIPRARVPELAHVLPFAHF